MHLSELSALWDTWKKWRFSKHTRQALSAHTSEFAVTQALLTHCRCIRISVSPSLGLTSAIACTGMSALARQYYHGSLESRIRHWRDGEALVDENRDIAQSTQSTQSKTEISHNLHNRRGTSGRKQRYHTIYTIDCHPPMRLRNLISVIVTVRIPLIKLTKSHLPGFRISLRVERCCFSKSYCMI